MNWQWHGFHAISVWLIVIVNFVDNLKMQCFNFNEFIIYYCILLFFTSRIFFICVYYSAFLHNNPLLQFAYDFMTIHLATSTIFMSRRKLSRYVLFHCICSLCCVYIVRCFWAFSMQFYGSKWYDIAWGSLKFIIFWRRREGEYVCIFVLR